MSATVQVDLPPEFTVVGEQVKLLTIIGAWTESVVDDEPPFSEPVTIAAWGVFTIAAIATNVLVDVPEATVTNAGTDSAFELLLARVTAAPPDGAFSFNATWQVEEEPDKTDVGEQDNAAT